ncbi:hypothetical protein BAUCODRAFT_429053 [Baudoinia panamericana UAMH 10762]|uniref:Uncharacterized protein n=1 Tax=Baudoinia panamericana (strain UAMH 10762) TaxID=717646 RepID=M2N3I9_BAUPA|nr:uncharacterized protein BAUCODRAFT_429053 [Baudoinia panamericana UAMH 10762]EMC98523.1 hypothetical protein BAUCODRAFT_429053 [Baudoinia panamericana UAMH 10762]
MQHSLRSRDPHRVQAAITSVTMVLPVLLLLPQQSDQRHLQQFLQAVYTWAREYGADMRNLFIEFIVWIRQGSRIRFPGDLQEQSRKEKLPTWAEEDEGGLLRIHQEVCIAVSDAANGDLRSDAKKGRGAKERKRRLGNDAFLT